ncbi:uncharacterized protein EDB91DRAFT_1256682 [Suillus paluster]|uniref:uncharacterized protein n=1 Tax=Suillus paluster TaxID=48578 RepID=UPI001B882F32|nr:uncharacterized protein EDB91DRAFT_1256682 [Suillus paluster]KAG1721096.1 hypothetical protein EDB91DRAFT_1256682 [Suillus paluster]
MSSTQDANDALDLVSDKIARLITQSEKLKQGDAAAKSLAHEIAITLVGAFTQYGNAATSFTPRLLSCAAKIRDNSGPNGKLRGLPDWTQISDDDPHIRVHPLFHKTVGYTHPAGPSTQEARLASPVPPATTSTREASMTLSPITSPTPTPSPPPTPAPAPTPKHNLFVPGTKHKASTPDPEPSAPEGDVIMVVRAPLPKKLKMELAVRKTATLPPSVSDEDSAEDTHPMRLFLTQCERCIKDDVPCTMMLGKKNSEVRKCCRNCDGKKTKCVRLSTEQQCLLRAAVALKGVKAAAAAEKKAQNGTLKNNAPPTQALTAEDDADAEGDDDPEHIPAIVLLAQPGPDVGPNLSVAQPTALDIFKSVEALSRKFNALLKTLDDRAEAFHQQMDSRVTALDQDWGSRFALMENRLREDEIKTANNTMSIGHVANSVRGLRAGQPLDAPPEGHPFGPIPPAWLALLPGTHEAIQSVDQGVSVVGKEWTTIWDPSKASGAHGPSTTSASAVFPAGSPTLPSGSHLSSIPSTPDKSEK